MTKSPLLDIGRDDRVAIGMLVYSRPWLDAAEVLLNHDLPNDSHGLEFAEQIYFLCMQSLEWSLKSFLFASGVSKKELRYTYGHRIVKLLEKAEDLGITALVDLSPGLMTRIRLVEPFYAARLLQYYERFTQHAYPLPKDVVGDVATIHMALDREYRRLCGT